MKFYECYLLGSAGEIRFCERIESDSERSAMALCRDILAARPHYASFELWRLSRMIGGEARRAAVPVAAPASNYRFNAGKPPPSLQLPRAGS